MLASTLVKLLLTVAGMAAVGDAVTGNDPHQVFNTVLNLIGAGAATVAFHFARNLYVKITEGDTPSTQLTLDLKESVVDLRSIVLDLKEQLAQAGTIDRRNPPDPPMHPHRRCDDE